MGIVGTRVLRVEDHRLVTGRGTYVDNLRGPESAGAAWLTLVRSPFAHARIRRVDAGQARMAPGVIAVFTAADTDLAPIEPESFISAAVPEMAQPCLAADTVRHVGDPVVAVVTELRSQGEDAAELVEVDYEPLPPLVDLDRSLAGAVLLYPTAGTNVVHEYSSSAVDDLFADCEVVVTQRLINQRLAPVPMEPRAVLCVPAQDGRLTVWASTQAPHMLRDVIAGHLELEPGLLRVIAPDVGGGFGAKAMTDPEAILVCWLARRLGRGVRWTESRSESMTALGHGRAQRQTVTIGGRRDGSVLAYRLDIVADAGAYPRLGAALPEGTISMATGVYAIARFEGRARSVVTTTTPVVAYRGAGRPEATAAIERAIDMFAAEIGLDPADVRRRNFVPVDAFPFVAPTGSEYDSGDYAAALAAVLAAADYPALRAEQGRRRAAGGALQLGVGISAYVDITGVGTEEARLTVRSDGTVLAHTGTAPHGQGHHTSFAMLVADRLGVDLERIQVVLGDTDELARGGGTFGSRSLQVGGSALHEAANRLCELIQPRVAACLNVGEDDVALDRVTGEWFVLSAPERRASWAELSARLEPETGLVVELDYKPAGSTCPFGVHLALVEVDTETGKAPCCGLSRSMTLG